jgi:hypothetical protein
VHRVCFSRLSWYLPPDKWAIAGKFDEYQSDRSDSMPGDFWRHLIAMNEALLVTLSFLQAFVRLCITSDKPSHWQRKVLAGALPLLQELSSGYRLRSTRHHVRLKKMFSGQGNGVLSN